MATPHYLSTRDNWEAAANAAGASLETAVAGGIRHYLDRIAPGQFTVQEHPKDLAQLYLEEDYKLNPSDYERPADPSKGDICWDAATKIFLKYTGKKWEFAKCGCEPDLKITHRPSGRAYFIECKAQKDAGNAQERACKYATPSMLAAIRAKIGAEYHPIGYLFSGQLVCDKKYIRELRLCFAFAKEHLLLWDPARPQAALEGWVERTIRPLLEGGAAAAAAAARP